MDSSKSFKFIPSRYTLNTLGFFLKSATKQVEFRDGRNREDTLITEF